MRHSEDLPLVAIFREMLLNYNEPFIRAQAESLKRYRSHYVGIRQVAGPVLPPERTLLMNRRGRAGWPAEAAFMLLGVSSKLVRSVRALDPVVLHAYTGVSGAHALPLARALGVPLVITFTGYDATASDAALRRRFFRGRVFLRRREAIKREGRLFIAVSDFIRRRLVGRGWPEARVVTHYIGVDTELFRPDPEVLRAPVAFFAGRLIETKGVAHLIAAMKSVQERVSQAELVIAGTGPLQGHLERQARDLRVRARFLGSVPADEVRRWMNRASVLCIPSVPASNGTVEAAPMVALESMSMGLPSVGFASGGIPEVVLDGRTGLLAPEGDRAALAANIVTLLTHTSAWTRLSIESMRLARERFDLCRQTSRLEDLYDRVRGSGPGPPSQELGSSPLGAGFRFGVHGTR